VAETLPVEPTTLDNYRTVAEVHVIPRLGGIALADLRAEHVDQLYRELEQLRTFLAATAHERLGRSGNSWQPRGCDAPRCSACASPTSTWTARPMPRKARWLWMTGPSRFSEAGKNARRRSYSTVSASLVGRS
jgi:hypothetical protein